jgi:hypothetical protein
MAPSAVGRGPKGKTVVDLSWRSLRYRGGNNGDARSHQGLNSPLFPRCASWPRGQGRSSRLRRVL